MGTCRSWQIMKNHRESSRIVSWHAPFVVIPEVSLRNISFIIKILLSQSRQTKNLPASLSCVGRFLENDLSCFSCHIFVMPSSYRRRYRSDRLLDYFIFLQELFQICAADFFEYLVQRDLFRET